MAKYQPPESTSVAGPSAITHAVAEQHDPLGEGGGELDVVGGDEEAGAAAGEVADQVDQVGLAGAVHTAGRLVEGDQARQLVAVHAARQGDRQCQPLALAAGEVARVGVDRVLQPDQPQGREPGIARAARPLPAPGPG